jgi:hypothetical protein
MLLLFGYAEQGLDYRRTSVDDQAAGATYPKTRTAGFADSYHRTSTEKVLNSCWRYNAAERSRASGATDPWPAFAGHDWLTQVAGALQ